MCEAKSQGESVRVLHQTRNPASSIVKRMYLYPCNTSTAPKRMNSTPYTPCSHVNFDGAIDCYDIISVQQLC